MTDTLPVGASGGPGGGAQDAPTRWLDETEQQAWRAYLGSTILLFDTLDRQLQQDSGLPHSYFEILVRLSEAPGRELRMSDLADGTMSSRSRLSHAAARLEERGWIERRNCPTDRRGQIAHLTDDGFAALAAAAPGHVTAVRRFVIDRLTPEQLQQLTVIGDAIAEGLAAEQQPRI